MVVNEKLLERLEKLSSIRLNDNVRKELIADFDDILKFVDNLNEIDTNNLKINNLNYTPLREDIPQKSEVIEDILKNAPSTNGHFFSVPKIIE
ncbi:MULTISPECIES: Asp-tRNA(Asn)/Glu-tRNA(Gln) amidotransferase subunit GatC [unclassified Campylobacter]|nr:MULTISPECIES: Asp-tRNA(Asn)/Glu-tRNA(Gln) amidotransferase subunit GatC [unclassified Campylobacter]MBT0882305.1 Asp-tRNA(Asn)/Glu-tRNA(Gln) amidotransferase subunit GatC [Campylobacter sp. 2018MI13]MBZ7975755.1 Asp-tRNA(Asn)/Glu-tRNA(Gln) amidotransferase subunit GatC [Campylobacter sp. RM12637]MBZ7977982.1 Asp-tRNA(Asn)/Glu-tRNA(Gln) amidotransferase subunit GatC [Campylobacter sp. RM12654]MBZ7979702.1 Asp-tRNA(Asn)/Glu-tRNA(Gln) amidotransferase subunit GatC [Campylobacter sp. RM12642]MB